MPTIEQENLKLDEVLAESGIKINTATPHTDQNLSPEEKELKWYREVYQGDNVKQLTLRAVLMGSLLGGIMSLSNLYVGLKTGWALGVAITACILSFTIWKALQSALGFLFGAKLTDMTILENNCMQSTASSAGYSTGGTMVSAIAAYLIITGVHVPWVVLTLWTITLAALGVFMAIPLKRQMINIEQLRFPSGIAAAETLKSLHAAGAEAAQKAKALTIAAIAGGVIAWVRDAGIKASWFRFLVPANWSRPSFLPEKLSIPGSLAFPGTLSGFPLDKWTLSFEMSSMMIAAGAIIGWKVVWSLLLGATVNYAFLAPWAMKVGAIDSAKLGYRSIVQWSTWTGGAIMVTSGLFMFALQWKTVKRAFSGITDILGKKKENNNDPLARIEVPSTWFVTGVALSGLGSIMVLHYAFKTSWWMGLIVIAMAFLLSMVAARATGESDITPMGAMGKITQLAFGAISPANMTTNLMTASLTANAVSSSADLLTDLKSGYLLGANPRRQFIAQFLGIFAGTLVVIPAFYILIPTASALGTDQWPAPAAQVWAAVAKLLSNGVHSLHPTARMGLLVGSLVGIALPVLELAFPKHKKFIPSATGIGLSMVIPFWNSLSMFIGGLAALILEKTAKPIADKYIVPVSSGFIAGESLIGILVALLTSFAILK